MPRPLHWTLTPELQRSLEGAIGRYEALDASLDMAVAKVAAPLPVSSARGVLVSTFRIWQVGVGLRWSKGAKVSLDGLLQLAFQAGFFACTGRFEST